jgi:hypothetical protein
VTTFHLTVDSVVALGPCWSRTDVADAFGDRSTVLLSEAVADPQLSTDDAIWLGCRALWDIDPTIARRFAVVVARWASIRFAERDTIATPYGPRWQGRPTPTTRVAWRHIAGLATDEEWDAARDARDAARDARDAAWDAARNHLVRMIRRAEAQAEASLTQAL